MLLDTNVVIGYMENEPKTVDFLSRLARAYVTAVVLGELYYGAINSSRASANTARVDRLLSEFRVLAFGPETARNYGELKAHLRKLGRPIPENDMWIAASAIENGLALLTNDKHFQHIPNLKVETLTGA